MSAKWHAAPKEKQTWSMALIFAESWQASGVGKGVLPIANSVIGFPRSFH